MALDFSSATFSGQNNCNVESRSLIVAYFRTPLIETMFKPVDDLG